MSRASIPVHVIGSARLTAGLDRFERLGLAHHLDVHGELPSLTYGQLVVLAERIGLRGRGGAGFPFARKVHAVRLSARRRGSDTVVVVNATEGEPASWKDKLLLLRAPHAIIDGALLAAGALHAYQIVIGVAEGEAGSASLTAALAERQLPVPARVVEVPSRFISGESGALVRAINGELPIPPGRKVLASDAGVNGLPTLLSNAETYAQLALAARRGVEGFASVGEPTEPGTVLLSVGGSARHPGVVESPTGARLAEVLRRCGAPVGAGVLTGGFHGTWITPDAAARAVVSRAGLAAVGGTLGAGIILPLGADTCPLGEVAHVVRYLAGESAGQCGPCRRGLPDLARRLARLADAGASAAAVEGVRAATTAVRGRGACAHPDGTSRFIMSALAAFSDDVELHERVGGCGRPVRGQLSVPGAAPGNGHLAVDWTRCDGHGLCAHILPELVSLDANGYPDIADQPVPAWLEGSARKAVDMCPALAIRINRTTTAASR